MRAPWHKTPSRPVGNLDLSGLDQVPLFLGESSGEPKQVSLELLDEDPSNPRTEFPANELAELVADIAERGILQPLVVAPADASGRYLIRFGAKRFRAARQAGLTEVPITVTSGARDAYDQVAENLKRHDLSPRDLARFIRSRVDAGESNATIAKCLAIDQTTVAHHLSLLALPPVLEEALETGRCASPRTLHELSKLHDADPVSVAALVAGEEPITREVVTALRDAAPTLAKVRHSEIAERKSSAEQTSRLLRRIRSLCERLDISLVRLLENGSKHLAADDLAALRQRIAALVSRLG